MSSVKLMSAKLHRVRVTQTHKDYVGSVTVDSTLMDQAGMLPLEEVEIVNVSNGNRWSTYLLPGEAGSGQICPNGGGAYLCQPDDILILFTYTHMPREDVYAKGHEATVVVADEHNGCQQRFTQSLVPQGGQKEVAFTTTMLEDKA